MLGRVLANVYGGVGVAAAAGYLLGGPVVDATSPRTAFVLVGCGGLAGAAVTAVLLRKARRQPATPAGFATSFPRVSGRHPAGPGACR